MFSLLEAVLVEEIASSTLNQHQNTSEKAIDPCNQGNEGLKFEDSPTCSVYDNVLTTRKSWTEHIEDFHAISETFACDSCPKVYSTKKSLKSHTKRKHSNENLPGGTSGFKPKVVRSLHQKTSRRSKVKPKRRRKKKINYKALKVPCPICQRLITKGSFEYHLTMHGPQNCEDCGESFENKIYLRR